MKQKSQINAITDKGLNFFKQAGKIKKNSDALPIYKVYQNPDIRNTAHKHRNQTNAKYLANFPLPPHPRNLISQIFLQMQINSQIEKFSYY